MKNILLGLLTLLAFEAKAQKVDVNKGVITVDGKEWAKLTVQKGNFGLTKTFEVFSLAGEKMIIAAPATEFEQDKSDNSVMYYRLTFLTSDQVGIFKLAALSQEKSFLKLITGGEILGADGKTIDSKVKELIAMRGASPTIAVDYTLVARNRSWPVRLQTDKNVEQDGKIIGHFAARGYYHGFSNYDFMFPSGFVIAKVYSTGCNNAQNFELFTAKDNLKRVVPIPQKENIMVASTETDKFQFTLNRIAKWLVSNSYL